MKTFHGWFIEPSMPMPTFFFFKSMADWEYSCIGNWKLLWCVSVRVTLVYTVYLTSFFFSLTSVLQVPEIISTLRQAGKSSARQEDTPSSLPSNGQPDASCSTATTADAATAFAKKFEVLFCGRVVVAHKKAPPALIDECIEKFGRVSVTGTLAAGIRRAFSLNQVTLKFCVFRFRTYY